MSRRECYVMHNLYIHTTNNTIRGTKRYCCSSTLTSCQVDRLQLDDMMALGKRDRLWKRWDREVRQVYTWLKAVVGGYRKALITTGWAVSLNDECL